MELSIRLLKSSDSKPIVELCTQLGYQVTSEDTTNRISEILAKSDNCAFCATENESVIGWIHGFEAIRIESGPFVEIGGLIIDEKYRHIGIGRKLVQMVIDWANSRNISSIRVRCNLNRKEAHQFYKNLGFIELKEQIVYSLKLS